MIFSDTLSVVLFPWIFSQTFCHHKRGTCSTWVVFSDNHFHRYSQVLNVNRPFLNWKKMIDSSSHGWFFLFWTIHFWYKVLCNIATYFHPYFFFIASVKLLQILRLFQKLLFSYTAITEMSSVKRNEKITCENCGTQTRRSIFWQYTRCSTGTLHFTQCPNFSTTSQTYLAFLL